MPHADLGERRVFYEEHGSGDPVLLVNGLGADHTAWALQTEYLQESFRVVVFDNPGVGQTEGPRGPYTTALFADVAVSLLRHLEIERAHVVGASMGGHDRAADRGAPPGRRPLARRPLPVVGGGPVHRRADPQLAGDRTRDGHARAVAPDLAVGVHAALLRRAPGGLRRARAAVGRKPPSADRGRLLRPGRGGSGPHGARGGGRHRRADPDHRRRHGHPHAAGARTRAARAQYRRSVLHVWPEMGHAPFWEIPDAFNRLNREFLEAH